jgi:two-component system sensor histidine kinase MprB
VSGAAAAVAVAIILASVAVYFIVQNELGSQIDASLRSNAATIINLAESKREGFGFATLYSPHVYQLNTLEPPFAGYFQLVRANGDVYIPGQYISRNNPLIKVTPQAYAVAAGQRGACYYDTQLQGQDTRVLTKPQIVSSSGSGGLTSTRLALQVATSLTGVNHELSRLRLWLFLIALGGVAAASGAGFLVARSTLRPVKNLSEAAERVRATRDLSQRISVAGGDELGQLAATFNEMLAALDEAAERQRRLVQDASHELRTPLTSLRTNIEVLANGGILPPEDRAQLLHDVIAQLGEMTAVVSELTALAQGEEQASAPEELRLDLLTEDAVRRTIRNHPDVEVDSKLSPTTVVATAASLERAVANLLDNAAKWSPPGAPIEVRVHDGELTVRDHGPGISQADVPHIFERFYRATSARSMPGSGLGLAIVQQVADANGGTVACELPSGGGTLMRLRLPVAAPVAPGQFPAPAAATGDLGSGADDAPEGRLAGVGAGAHAAEDATAPQGSRRSERGRAMGRFRR